MRASPLTFTRKQWEPLAFASPALVLIALVILFPLAYSFYLSFQNFDLSVGPEREFVGLQNYTEALFRDERFMASIWNTAVIIAPSLVVELLLGLGIALLLNQKIRGRPIVTALLAIPAMVSPLPLPCREVPGLLPGGRRVSGRDREDVSARRPRPCLPRRRRIPAQALLRDHGVPRQAEGSQGGARHRGQGVGEDHRPPRARQAAGVLGREAG